VHVMLIQPTFHSGGNRPPASVPRTDGHFDASRTKRSAWVAIEERRCEARERKTAAKARPAPERDAAMLACGGGSRQTDDVPRRLR
jgi:hypothetical protein